MISAIIPTYRMPDHLDLCVKSAVENKVNDETEIIVVVDGYVEESREVLSKYGDKIGVLPLEQNGGMANALNLGVMNAQNEYVFILNDDNVFGNEWDQRIMDGVTGTADPENTVVTISQVEPADGIFNFVTNNLGRNASEFDYDTWLKFENEILVQGPTEWRYTDAGRLFPFVVSKRWYMVVGGFDTFYKSPFWVDCDWWLKLELTKQLKFYRFYGAHLYHFGSIATKNRGDAESKLFKKSEREAAQTFYYKWRYLPNIVENAKFRNNSKLPVDEGMINGIKFS